MNAKKIADLLIDMWEQGSIPLASTALRDYTAWLGAHWQSLDAEARQALLGTGAVMMDAMLKESWGGETADQETPENTFLPLENDVRLFGASETMVSMS